MTTGCSPNGSITMTLLWHVHALIHHFAGPIVEGVLDRLRHHRIVRHRKRGRLSAVIEFHWARVCRIGSRVLARLSRALGGEPGDLLVDDAVDVDRRHKSAFLAG